MFCFLLFFLCRTRIAFTYILKHTKVFNFRYFFLFLVGDTTIYIIIISGTAAGCFVCIFFALIASFYYYKKERPRDRVPIGLLGNYVEVEVEVGIVIEAVDVTLISEIPENGTVYSVETVENGIERIAKNDVPILNTPVVFVPSSTFTNNINSSPSSCSSSCSRTERIFF